MLEILSMVATLMGVLLSLIFGIRSIELTKQQISISNKQELFDRRFECYRLLSHIHTLCESNLHLIDNGKDSDYIAVDFVAFLFTNSTDFYKMSNVFKDKAEQTDKVTFLSGVEFLHDKSLQAKFLFPQAQAEFISNYFDNYADLLNKLYEYKCLLDHTKELPNRMPGTDTQIANSKQELLHGGLAKETINDIEEYKEALVKLNNTYSDNINYLDAYISLISEDVQESKREANKCFQRKKVFHIIPWSKGGHTTDDSLQMSCKKCNAANSDK